MTSLDGRLAAAARERPDSAAMILPARVGFRTVTYAELERRVEEVRRGLLAAGIGPGVRTALMVPPTRDFFVLTFALLRLRAVPVLIDPGIGLQHLRTCLGEAAPGAFIGVPKAHAARRALGWAPTARVLVTVGPALPGGGRTLRSVQRAGRALTTPLPARPARGLAAILFTSGSTGIPKGVEYREEHFLAQVDLLRRLYGFGPGEVNLATFPPFALFGPALGMTTVIPRMDPTRPADVDPPSLVATARRYGVTTMFGSPALLDTVSRWAVRTGATIPTLRRVMSAGAPVPRAVQRDVLAMLPPGAEVHTPYGATEALPVTSIGSDELLALPEPGICVGRPVPGVDLALMRVTDEPVAALTPDLLVPAGEVGEVVVRGPNVTTAYADRPEATRLAKLDWDGRVAHRMGDLAWTDADGRLWFAGRKVHRVRTAAGPMYSVPCEEVFNTHPAVRRSALVGVGPPGEQEPVIVVERAPLAVPYPDLTAELLELAGSDERTAPIRRVLYHPSFPVDIRHNSKIDRETLVRWAATR